jgi:hypothetical protein
MKMHDCAVRKVQRKLNLPRLRWEAERPDRTGR